MIVLEGYATAFPLKHFNKVYFFMPYSRGSKINLNINSIASIYTIGWSSLRLPVAILTTG